MEEAAIPQGSRGSQFGNHCPNFIDTLHAVAIYNWPTMYSREGMHVYT